LSVSAIAAAAVFVVFNLMAGTLPARAGRMVKIPQMFYEDALVFRPMRSLVSRPMRFSAEDQLAPAAYAVAAILTAGAVAARALNARAGRRAAEYASQRMHAASHAASTTPGVGHAGGHS
jgi:hypothetical protein